MAGIETLKDWITEELVDTVILAGADLQGRPIGKRVTAPFFTKHVQHHGIEMCDYVLSVDIDMTPLPGYGFTGWESGYGDLVAKPDYSTVRLIPWLEKSAMVLCDLVTANEIDVPVSPRAMLRKQIERAKEHGISVECATELEFYLFKESFEECEEKQWSSLTPHSSTIEDYQIFQTSREEYILARIRNEMIEARVPVEFSKGEAGRGQHEVNVTYADALETADRHLVFKNGVKEIAAQEGRAATFMAKWTMDEVGSSCHIHASLWKDTEPVMADEKTPRTLSQIGKRFLAGQMHSARSLAWCFAPTLNSYRRYISGSWAPTAIVWGEDNRTCGFRVIGKGRGCRIENRIPGADVNPYIALAATIAAGLYGIEHDLELPAMHTGNAYETASLERIPSTLVQSLGELEKSEVAKEAFGGEVHAHLINTARQEWEASNGVVTDWELRRNFERI